jgi:hypothetical protein
VEIDIDGSEAKRGAKRRRKENEVIAEHARTQAGARYKHCHYSIDPAASSCSCCHKATAAVIDCSPCGGDTAPIMGVGCAWGWLWCCSPGSLPAPPSPASLVHRLPPLPPPQPTRSCSARAPSPPAHEEY